VHYLLKRHELVIEAVIGSNRLAGLDRRRAFVHHVDEKLVEVVNRELVGGRAGPGVPRVLRVRVLCPTNLLVSMLPCHLLALGSAVVGVHAVVLARDAPLVRDFSAGVHAEP
jgi:hypothetical protein